jgi:hypothetical protein
MVDVALTELQRIPTSGARAVEVFHVGGTDLLAIPQLARDVPGGAAGMNGGDSDTDLLLLRLVDDRYEQFATLPGPGGEDAEFFTVGERAFLAVASIRTGAGPYEYTTSSRIFEWVGGTFAEFQAVPTHAAKQWRHWRVADRHFLGLAQGVEVPHVKGPNRQSMIYEWDGAAFAEFQAIPSRWAYNWHPFRVGDDFFVAHADHLDPSVLYRWDGRQYVAHQQLRERTGRAFADFTRDGDHYLLVAGIEEPPVLMRWTGEEFTAMQELDGPGARELLAVEHGGRLYVFRINFITGTPAAPNPVLRSQIYEWRDGELVVVAEFPTSGGTDVAVVPANGNPGELRFVVSNSLSAQVRFATDTVLYSLSTAVS